jgi:hypothetical protein
MPIKRQPAQIERDRRKIAQAYLAGRSQMDIASELGLDQSTVSRDLTAIQKEWRIARIDDIDERKHIELAKIDNLELTYWESFTRSCMAAASETTKMIGAGGSTAPQRVEQTRREDAQVGDPRFLSGVQWCIEKRCALLGLDAPKKQDFTTNGKSLSDVVHVYLPANGRDPDQTPT